MAKKRTRSRSSDNDEATMDDNVRVESKSDDSKSDRPRRKKTTRSRSRSSSDDGGDEQSETRTSKPRSRAAKSDVDPRTDRDGEPRNESGGSEGGSNSDGGGGGGSRRSRNRSGNRGRGGGNNNGGGNNRSRRRRSGGGSRNGGGNNGNYRGGNNQNRNGRRGGQKRSPEPVEFDDAELTEGIGLLELHPNGYGFLREPTNNFSRERSDPFVPGTMIEKFGLRPGVMIKGKVQPARRQQGPRLRELIDIDGKTPEEYLEVPNFDQLTPINPEQWYQMETGPTPLTTRVMDLLTPLGKGQRALIVAPPRSGKTIMLQHIAHGIATNYPDTKLIVLLIDERPEEVTDMKRNVNGEVIASSLDEDIESHVRLSQLVIQRCKRLTEMGQDVFLLMDSITRLARAFNKWVGNTGRTMSGGVDIKAMDIPKKLFSSARAFEEGGSLTIVGTALVDTGSRMDELIFQEFKGTGNMELVLDRKLADRRVWPAIDISQSGTRREELLLNPDTLHAVTMLRRTLTSMHHVEAMEQLTRQLGRFKTNEEFIQLISGKMGDL